MFFLNQKKYILADQFNLDHEIDFVDYAKSHLIEKADIDNIQPNESILKLLISRT